MKKHAYHKLPVYQKSLVLKDLSKAIAHYFSYDNDFFIQHRKSGLRTDIAKALFVDASLITNTIQESLATKSGSTQNQHLAFINIMTGNILSYCNGLEKDGVKEKEYINLLRTEIKSFRSYFKQWRKSISTGEN